MAECSILAVVRVGCLFRLEFRLKTVITSQEKWSAIVDRPLNDGS